MDYNPFYYPREFIRKYTQSLPESLRRKINPVDLTYTIDLTEQLGWTPKNTIIINCHGAIVEKGIVLPQNTTILYYGENFKYTIYNDTIGYDRETCPNPSTYSFRHNSLYREGSLKNKVLVPSYYTTSDTITSEQENLKPHLYKENDIMFDISLHFSFKVFEKLINIKNDIQIISLYDDFKSDTMTNKFNYCSNYGASYSNIKPFIRTKKQVTKEGKKMLYNTGILDRQPVYIPTYTSLFKEFFVEKKDDNDESNIPGLEEQLGSEKYKSMIMDIMKKKGHIKLSYLINKYLKGYNIIIKTCKSNNDFLDKVKSMEDIVSNKVHQPIRMLSYEEDDASPFRETSEWLQNNETKFKPFNGKNYITTYQIYELFLAYLKTKYDLSRTQLKVLKTKLYKKTKPILNRTSTPTPRPSSTQPWTM